MYLKKTFELYNLKAKETFRLHNPETNHAYEKKNSDYVIRKLITNLKKLSDHVIQNIKEGYFLKYEIL